MNFDSIGAVILAAGKGTRMEAEKPKVLQTVGGKPIVFYILDKLTKMLDLDNIVVVAGYKYKESIYV